MTSASTTRTALGPLWQHQARRPSRKPAVLRPGRNTLAISLHPETSDSPALDFDLTLLALASFATSAQMAQLSTPVTGDNTTSIQWVTDTASATSLRYGSSRAELSNLINLSAASFIHLVNLPNPPLGGRIYYEILKGDGSSYEPPAINSIVGAAHTIFPFESQWSYLSPSNPITNRSIDPALLDPDFYQTWSTQPLGNYQGNPDYDGPAFSSTLPAPFGPEPLNPKTEIPGYSPIWFIKEVDGGTTGFDHLKLTGIRNTPMTIFLNGNQITETHIGTNNQANWAEWGSSNISSGLLLPDTLILPPGPNLIAVQMHRSFNSGNLTFDLSLSGLPLENKNSLPTLLQSTSTSAKLSWATSQTQSTRLRWGLSPSSFTESIEGTGNSSYHEHTLPDLSPSTTYFVEVLDSSGNSHTPPTINSFRTNDHLILSRQSSGWSVLESISDGAFVDPALDDPDFLTTWYDPDSYDGPPFLENQSAPFSTSGTHLRVGQTTLQSIDKKNRPVWLLKEIDGGETGYQSLTLNANYGPAFAAFLNGQLITFKGLGSNDRFGSWHEYAGTSGSSNSDLSLKLAETITLTPGPNTLAIALHPIRSDIEGSLIGEFELRGVPIKLAISKPTLQYLSYTQIALAWTTSRPTTSRISYGLDPLSPDNVLEDPELKTDHLFTSSDLPQGGSYIFEIIATDALGNSVTSVGSFNILPQLMRLPFLQKAAPTSMTINWRTRDPGTSLIRYGQNPANLDQVTTGTSQPAPLIFTTGPNEIITDHSTTLTGLTPATKYYYQIASDAVPAPASDLEQFFTTPPFPSTPAKTRIWVVGDSGQPGQGVQDVKDAYLQYTADTATDVWLMLGDNAYNSGNDSEYQAALFDTFPELLKNTPVWPTMGNHDGRAKSYYGIFDLPTDGESGGVPSGTEKYYSFDHGNIHFICLNSEEDPPGMLDWLKNDLQSTRADWIIAFFHHGPYTRGSHNSDNEQEHRVTRGTYLPILENYGVDLVLSGHSHQYERSHLLDDHYGSSSSYRIEEHALDPSPGSPFGTTSRTSGLFQYSRQHLPYHKTTATPNSGQVSLTVGASSILSSWSSTNSGNSQAITHPNPHPVHVATIRALGSMVIDIEGHTLHATYLDSNGQTRDHFQINKVPEVSPAITWWQNNFGADSYPYFADWFSDPDHDTHSNLSEYALGGDPLVGEQLIEAVLSSESIDNNPTTQWFTVQYNRREGAGASVEVSQNLVQFTTSGIETRRLTEPDANGIARWESRVRRTNQRALFFRIEVSR